MIHKMLQAPSLGAYLTSGGALVQDLVQAVILGVIIIVMAVPEGASPYGRPCFEPQHAQDAQG